MKYTSLGCAALALAVSAPLLQAEIIKIPVGQQPSSEAGLELPAHGESRATVKARYGDPVKWTEAVGEPPISRWQYPGFAVYFEYDHVVHAVMVGSAKAVR